MKRKRLNLQLTEEQQLIIGIILVVLVAISMLYCLGLASVALHQAWERSPLRWDDTENNYSEEILELTPETIITPTDTVPAPF